MEQSPCGLCVKGCGFYGNDAFEGMCSKCFKDNVKRQQQTSTATPQPPPPASKSPDHVTDHVTAEPHAEVQQSTPTPTTEQNTVTEQQAAASSPTCSTDTSTCLTPAPPVAVEASIDTPEQSSSSSSTADSPFSDGSPGDMKKRNRCYSCKKKVGLTGFECRCGGLYCGLHRYSDKHNCTFDYKSDGREQLAKANPVIVGEKVKKL